MERAGADVVSFDVGYDVSIDLYPAPGNVDTRKLRLDHARSINEVQNSWWYLHRAFASSARIVYGDFYALPADLGAYDVSRARRDPVAPAQPDRRRSSRRRATLATRSW